MKKAVTSLSFVHRLLSFLGYLYIVCVYKTSTWRFSGLDIPKSYVEEGKSFLTCFWHKNLFMLPYAWAFKKNPFYMLISAHKDGRLISDVVGHFGIKTVAGSKNKAGEKALWEMKALSKKGVTLGITPDGPRGPAQQVSEGTVIAAYLMKTDLIPVTYYVTRKKIFKTWDRFVLPHLWNRGCFLWGKPIPYPKTKEDIPKVQDTLKKSLDLLDIQAAERVDGAMCER